MLNRIFAIVIFLIVSVFLISPFPANAQGPNPADQVFSTLVSSGYDVLKVDNFPDAQGNPDPNAVYAEMETITTNFDDRYLINQALEGFDALAKFYPKEQYYIVVLKYDRWLYFFVTNPQDWDDVLAKRVKGLDFWATVRNQARIFDTVQNKYVTPKDFLTINQTNKNQTNKDFSGLADSPLPPVNTNPSAEAENILFEPSTTYLPADGTTQGYLLATLTDKNFSGLPGRGVNFSFEVRGQEPKNLPSAQTDQFGTARTKIASSRPLDLVLIHADTTTLDASVQILVGTPPGKDADKQKQAVIDGLTSQGYRDADADYEEYTSPVGAKFRESYAAVRVTSKSFDREVYSQLSRMLGTMRTVMPDATILNPLLQYAAPDGHDYTLIFTMRAEIWDAYVRGDIGENELWANLDYNSAVDENGVRTNEKNFVSKNFSGTTQTKFSSVQRQVNSTLTTESWGDQLTVGSFLVPVGGYADTFSISELSGSATGFQIYATPDYNTPVFKYTKGDDAGLQALRLESGQYIVEVNGAVPPAQLVLQFVEHLGR